ncbi:hypothetical protein KC384_15195, partial [Listeria monocytogenes]
RKFLPILPKPLIATFSFATVSPLTGVDVVTALGMICAATASKKDASPPILLIRRPENSATSSLLEEH